MNDQEQGTGIGWLLAWLVFGLLTALEAGALAMRAGGEWGALYSLAFLVCGLVCLGVLLFGAIAHARPAKTYAPIAISLLVLLGCLWGLYGRGESASGITTALFGAAYSTICLLAGLLALAIAGRKRRANEQRLAEANAERDRRRRLEGVRAESSALAAAAAAAAANADGSDPLGPDSDFVLPSRPKWEES
ncbi:MAG: hypothetical protein JSS14_23935 [Proteobacteria bacterium]|nr:hypothetical protein [Pseudomonadota bacterium]